MHNILIDGSKEAKNILILAHGAGSPMDSCFMNSLVKNLVTENFLVIRFEFPYMQKRRNGIKLFPDTIEILSDYFISVIKYIKDKYSGKYIWVGGKSMGGRVACHISKVINIKGVIVFGYPFYSLKNPNKVRLEVLRQDGPPILIIQGDRDKMGNKEEILNYILNKSVKIVFLEGGDHSFLTIKKAIYSQKDLIGIASKHAYNFIKEYNYIEIFSYDNFFYI